MADEEYIVGDEHARDLENVFGGSYARYVRGISDALDQYKSFPVEGYDPEFEKLIFTDPVFRAVHNFVISNFAINNKASLDAISAPVIAQAYWDKSRSLQRETDKNATGVDMTDERAVPQDPISSPEIANADIPGTTHSDNNLGDTRALTPGEIATLNAVAAQGELESLEGLDLDYAMRNFQFFGTTEYFESDFDLLAVTLLKTRMIEVDNDHNATVYYGDDAKLKEVFDGRARAEKMHQIMWANVFKEMPAGDRKIFDDRLKQITKTLGVQDEIHVPFDDSNYLSDLRTSILDKIKDPDGYLAQNGMRSKAVEAQVNSFTYALICAGVFTPDDYDKGKHRGIVDAMVELANADAVDTMINAMVPGGDLSGVNDTDANSIVNMLLTASPNMQRNAAERAFHEKCKELKIDFSKEVEGFEGGITTLGNVLQTATAKIANEKMLAFIEARKKHGTEQVFDADRVSDIGGKLPKVEEKFQYFPKISKRPYRALNQTMKKMQELASLMTSGFQKTVSAGSWYKGMSAEEFENTYRLGRVNERAANLIGYYEVLAYRNPLAMKKIYAALEISTDDADAAAALLSGQTYKEPWKGEEQLREMKEWSNFVEWKNEQARMKESEWTTEDEEEGDPSSEEEITPEAGIEPEEVAPVEIMTWPDNLNETQIEEYKTAITEFEKLPPEDQKKLNAECGAEIQTYARLLKMKDKLEAFRLGNLKGLFNKKDDDALDKDIEFLRGRIQEFDGSIDVTEKLGYIRGAAALESIGGAPANYAGKENDPPLQGARTGKSQPKDAVSVVSEGFKKSFGFKGRTLDLLRITMDRPDLAEEDIEPFKKQFMSHMTKEVMNDPGRFMQEYDALVLEVEQKAQARSKGKINT